VTLTAQNNAGQSGNRIQSINFSATLNAVVDIGNLTDQSGSFPYTAPPNTPQVQFLVRRVSGPGVATRVSFTVNDLCDTAPWRSFVGLGTGVP
jgi:hypothetical protein